MTVIDAFVRALIIQRAAMTKTKEVVFRVFMQLEGTVSYEVDRKDWADMERDIIPPNLAKLCAEAMDTGFYEWLQAYCEKNPFEMGQIQYGKD